MNVIGIAIGATGLLLLLLFVWMLVLSVKRKHLEQERRRKEYSYRKAMEKNRKQEREEKVYKAENGDIPTMLYLAAEAERTNLRQALYWYNKAAHLDSVTGMYGVVRISAKMREDLVLREQARFWQVCISASEGSLESKYDMAIALFHGRGTTQNISKAIVTMTQVAAQSHLPAILFLGQWYCSEDNPEPEPEQSTEWFKKAVELKSNEGRMMLGLNYINGVGVEADFSRGCYWLERASEKGYTDAMYNAGSVWMERGSNGRSIAYIWLFIAGQLGHEEARILRDKVAMNIGVDIVVGLQSLSKPMIRRIREKKVPTHSLIKALNKLYKRSIPTQEEPEQEVEELSETIPPEFGDKQSYSQMDAPLVSTKTKLDYSPS
ncbi:sel1 repeat family protein [Vibrio sinensis]|uniref:Sel1 repeat family protein n=1 Tax=Vibrio sinensis TaxID=2302434 RepID=A0A3A6Q712_9VIBR|nr:tetratricopeptide repeat protein [Vibrio sinensis]RJX66525.1 sel1 repeat family protein [Vibrio sinensis]